MVYVPLEEDLFRVNVDTPVLLGSHCASCGRSFFPRRRCCAVCFNATEQTELSAEGVLHTYTYVRAPFFGKCQVEAAAGYGVGQVDLPEGVRIQTVLRGGPGNWNIGMPMRIGLEVIDEEEGDQVVIFSFTPAPTKDATLA